MYTQQELTQNYSAALAKNTALSEQNNALERQLASVKSNLVTITSQKFVHGKRMNPIPVYPFGKPSPAMPGHQPRTPAMENPRITPEK